MTIVSSVNQIEHSTLVDDLSGLATADVFFGQTATEFGLSIAGDFAVVFSSAGGDFANYSGNLPNTGQVTGLTLFRWNGSAFEARATWEGFAITVLSLTGYINTNDVGSFILEVFGGADDIEGGDLNTNGDPNELYGYDGADTIGGGILSDIIDGGAGADIVDGDSGNDILRAVGAEFEDGESYDGGGDFDTLVAVGQLTDFSIGSVFNIERLTFESASGTENLLAAKFSEQQLGPGIFGTGLATNLSVVGTGRADVILVQATAGLQLNMTTRTQNWTFTNFNGFDYIGVLGTNSPVGDNLIGSRVNDYLIGLGGNDILNGGAGIDFAVYASAIGAVTVNLALANQQLIGGGQGRDTLSNIEGVIGGNFADTLTGNAGDNLFIGGAGNDTINGAGGSDLAAYFYAPVSAGQVGVRVDLRIVGAQAIGAGQGSDTLTSIEAVLGSFGNDILIGNAGENYLLGIGGDDVLNGAGGFDYADYTFANAGVTVSLSVAGAQAVGGGEGLDTLIAIEGIYGSLFHDVLTGNNLNNELVGEAGNDTLTGFGGVDLLEGGAGNDILNGGLGADFMNGGLGNDTYYVNIGGAAGDTVMEMVAGVLGGINDSVFSTVTYQAPGNIENVYLQGNTNINASGNSLNNIVAGNGGANVLIGALGNDRLYGNGGNDTLTGGGGVDVFVFTNAFGPGNVDRITDMNPATEQIWIDNAIAPQLGGAGALDVEFFYVIGSGTQEIDDYIVYNQTTGQLFFDQDGVGAIAAIHFATVNSGQVLAANDFLVI